MAEAKKNKYNLVVEWYVLTNHIVSAETPEEAEAQVWNMLDDKAKTPTGDIEVITNASRAKPMVEDRMVLGHLTQLRETKDGKVELKDVVREYNGIEDEADDEPSLPKTVRKKPAAKKPAASKTSTTKKTPAKKASATKASSDDEKAEDEKTPTKGRTR